MDNAVATDIIAESPNRRQRRRQPDMSSDASPPRVMLKTPQSLVHIKHSITLKQYKLWILMLKHHKEHIDAGKDTEDLIMIPKAVLDDFFGYENVKQELVKDLEALRQEPIIFNILNKDGEPEQRGQGFISEWAVSSTRICFKLPTYIAEALANLDEARLFSLLNLSVFNKLTGKYEAFLYKLCADYVGINRTPELTVEEYRTYMGLNPGEYEAGRDLNKFLIQGPTDNLNNSDICDIEIEPVYKRQGRKIVGVYFKVQYKKQQMLKFPPDKAFSKARLPIPPISQQRYISMWSPDEIELSIERANAYIDKLKKKGASVEMGAIYNKAIEENWGAQLAAQREIKAREQAEKASQRMAVMAQERSEEEQKLRELYLKELQTTAIKNMEPDTIRAEAKRYLEEYPDKARFYDDKKPGFTNPIERIGFGLWLQGRLKLEVTEDQFTAWRESRRTRK